MLTDDVAKLGAITAIATEGLHQDRNARLVLDNQLPHDLVQVWPMVAAIPAGDMYDVVLGLLVAVIAPIDMKAGAIQMGKAGRKAQALGRRRRNETVECGDAIAIERIQGSTEGIVVELVGRHTA